MLLHDFLDFHAKARGDNIFARFQGTDLSYSEAQLRSTRMASALSGMGLKHSQRVAVLMQNSVDLLLTYYAISRLGAVIVPLNYRLAPQEWDGLIEDSEAAMIIADPIYCDQLDNLSMTASLIRVSVGDAQPPWLNIDAFANQADEQALDVSISADDVLFQMYTSGTTGRPKGALLTHHNIITNLAQSSFALPNKNGLGRNILVVLPLFHMAAISLVLGVISSGGTMILHANVDPAAIVQSLEEDDICAVSLVPAVIQLLLVSISDLSEKRFPHLQSIAYGASPIAEPVLRQAMEVFDCAFVQAYGMTEIAGICTILSEADHRKALADKSGLLLSAGRVIPGVDMKIADSDGVELPPGEIGEILLRGEQIMSGYWKMPDATAAALRDGWLHTGDAGYMDADGYLFIRDRIKDMIVSGAENIYPAEIEQILSNHPGIVEVAVIGVPDERWGETVMAVIVRKPDMMFDATELDVFCRGRLGGFKVPRHYKFVDALPRSAAGKILKRELREEYWRGQSRQVG